MKDLIENHKKAAKHLEEAAKFHMEAAKNHEVKDHDKAHYNTILAQGHTNHAKDVQKDILDYHTNM